jgi:nucleoside-diphosphate-sugar epimerase
VNILITGTNGFLGGATYRFLSHKHNVFPLKRKVWDNRTSQLFITDKIKPDILINFGWGGGSDNKDLNSIEQFDNIKTCIDLFNFGVECGVKRFIQVSSSWEFYYHYGITEYGLSKYFANRILSRMARLSGVKFSRIVPYWIYGPNDRQNRFIPSIIKKCLNDEKIELHPAQNEVDYLFIDDFVKAVGVIVEKGNELGYNICSKRGYKVQDIVEKIKSLTNSKSEITYNKDYPPNFNMEWVGDNTKLENLGWHPRIGIEEGLKKTIEWHKNK